MALPPPTGPFSVGSITRELCDPDRPANLTSRAPGRSLFLKLWYPAEPAAAAVPEALWDELRHRRRTPLLLRWLVRGLRRGTVSYPGAPLARATPALGPVLYHHALVSFASENTSLAQDLASRGHVVVAMEHLDQLAELRGLNRRQSRAERRSARDLAARFKRADAAERARLAVRLYAAAAHTERIVLERACDTRFVLDRWAEVVAGIPGDAGAVESSAFHLVGYSVGGAVATRVAWGDRRILSVVNLDGGLYGSLGAAERPIPYLMIYSSGNEGINDDLLPNEATCRTAAGTEHLNFHDVAALLPPLRWIRAVGPADPAAVLRWRNQTVAEFLDAHGEPVGTAPRAGASGVRPSAAPPERPTAPIEPQPDRNDTIGPGGATSGSAGDTN